MCPFKSLNICFSTKSPCFSENIFPVTLPLVQLFHIQAHTHRHTHRHTDTHMCTHTQILIILPDNSLPLCSFYLQAPNLFWEPLKQLDSRVYLHAQLYYLLALGQESKQRPMYHMAKYLKVVNQVNEVLINYALSLCLNKYAFIKYNFKKYV